MMAIFRKIEIDMNQSKSKSKKSISIKIDFLGCFLENSIQWKIDSKKSKVNFWLIGKQWTPYFTIR